MTLIHDRNLDPPPQRWAAAATWLAILLPVPSIIWRLAMLAGADTGFANAELFRSSTEGVGYVLALCLLELLVCLGCWGLIRPWGERLPTWLPVLGGRSIPRAIPTAIALLGAAVLTWILGTLLVSFVGSWLGLTDAWTPADGMTGTQRLVLGLAYAPFFAWPVPIVVAAIGYWQRRRPANPQVPVDRATGEIAGLR